MKAKLLFVAVALLASLPVAFAQLTIPSDGSDGAFNPATSIQIDLTQAVTGVWSDNNTANAGKGIFDPDKWAIVFKYASVNIPAGVAVTFKNHVSHAPVVWLVQGSVNIAGTVSVNGAIAVNSNLLTEPGPGGFRGGIRGTLGTGAGLGFGGVNPAPSTGASYASAYGNPSIIPLIGGSGGGGGAFGSNTGGGGGAGAILIAAPNSINFSGSAAIVANGGLNSSPGSGGAIRLVANVITGTATLNANTDGRIRIETNSISSGVVPTPQVISVPPANPPVIWPASTAPTVRVVSVAAVAAPTYPTAPLDTSADVGISVNGATQVILQTTNFPTNGLVQVRSAAKFGANAALTTATLQSGDANSALWSATITFATGFTTLQARATVP